MTVQLGFHAANRLPPDLVNWWDKTRLAQDPLACFTTGPRWFGMMAEDHDPVASVCVAETESDLPAMVVPLLIQRTELTTALFQGRLGTGELKVARVFGGEPVWDGRDRYDLADVWVGILERYPGVAAIRMDHLSVPGRTAQIVESCKRNDAVFPAWEFRGMPHYRLQLPATFGECCSVRSGRSIKQIRRHARRMTERAAGKLRLDEMRTPDELRSNSSDIESLMGETWQAAVLGHSLDVSDAVRVAGRGWVRAFLLRAGPDPVAFVLCYQADGTLIREQSGYSAAYAKYYPGEVLLYMMLERLYEERTPRVVDFGVGEGYHKRMFSNDMSSIDAVWVVRNTAENRLRFARFRAAKAVDMAVRAIAEKAGLKKRLMRRRKGL